MENVNLKKESVRPDFTFQEKKIYHIFKRMFDIVASFIGMIAISPILILIAVIIVIDSPGASPVYKQERIGKNGVPFKLYKFRSMVANAETMLETLLEENDIDVLGFKIDEDPRITKVGSFIRKTSLDELPQLFNVLKGDMSLVGPRPSMSIEADLFDDYQKQRLLVTPGITCYWQVQPKRNSLSFDRRVELDLEYIEKRSFITDIEILLKTVGAVLHSEGQ